MKSKIKKFVIGNIKTLIAFVLGVILSGTTIYAATILFAAKDVTYNPSNSNLQSTNVQDAIEELYKKANNVYCTNGKTKQNETDYSYECK